MQRPPSVFRQSHKVSGCTSALKICGFWRPDTIAGGCLPDISRNDASLSAIPASLDALCTKKIWRGRVRVLPVRSGRSKSQRRFPILIVTFSSGYRRHRFARGQNCVRAVGAISPSAMGHGTSLNGVARCWPTFAIRILFPDIPSRRFVPTAGLPLGFVASVPELPGYRSSAQSTKKPRDDAVTFTNHVLCLLRPIVAALVQPHIDRGDLA